MFKFFHYICNHQIFVFIPKHKRQDLGLPKSMCQGQIRTGTASFARVATATPSSILKQSKKCTPSFLSSAHTSHTCFGGFCCWIQRQMYIVYSKFWPGSHLELSRSSFGIILRHPFLDPQETCARHWSTVVSS